MQKFGFFKMVWPLQKALSKSNQKTGKEQAMRNFDYKTVQLGELVVAVFDNAEQYSSDSKEVSRLAALAISRILRRAKMNSISPSQFTFFNNNERNNS